MGMRWLVRLGLLVVLLAAVPGVAAQDGAEGAPFEAATFTVGLELVADGLEEPLYAVGAGDGRDRLFIVEKPGRIMILDGGQVLDTPFLDITDRVGAGGSEQGLLGVAFHPDYAENGLFFVDYTDQNGDTVISRFAVSAENPDRADASSEQPLLAVAQPFPNHNGGQVLFGPDGYLYIGLGDGGSGGDPEGNAQNLATLLGSVLRIDVDPDAGEPYGIPTDNPFLDTPDARPEIWAYGLRNPWRFSFDRATGDFYLADVGQNQFEEINALPAGDLGGENYGWPIMEASSCYETDDCATEGLVLPVAEYSHDVGGCSVTGGYVYRGEAAPSLQGIYLYADYCSGLLWGLGRDAAGDWVSSRPIETGLSISSFGQDDAGEVYVTDLQGGVYRVTEG